MTTQAAAGPPSPMQAPPPRSRGFLALTVVVTVLAAAAAVLAVGFSHSFAEMYGEVSTPADFDWLPVIVLAGIPGVLVGAAVTMLARLTGRQAPLWATMPLAIALMWVLTGWQADAGARQHAIDQAIIATACSPADVAVLDSMRGLGTEYSGAAGQKNGDCSAWVMVRGDEPRAAMADVAARLGSDGWSLRSGDWADALWVKGSAVVRVTHIQSSDGSTGVGLVVVSSG